MTSGAPTWDGYGRVSQVGAHSVRLHAGIGYASRADEHDGRGPGIRRARYAGLRRTRAERIKQDRRPRSPPALTVRRR